MNKNAQQVIENQNVEARGVSVLRAECDPSLKCGFAAILQSSGFASEADAIRTLARDFVMGRLQYIGGMLRSQEKNGSTGSPSQAASRDSETGHRDSIAGPTPAPVSSNGKNQGQE